MRSMLRSGIRQFAQQPGFSVLVVLTLGLTVGIVTAAFSLFDAVLLRPFPIPDAGQLVRVRTYKPQVTSSTGDASIYDFWDWQKMNRSFVALAAYASFPNNLSGIGETQVVRTTSTSPELFRLLSTPPLYGRTFTTSENEYHGDVRKVVLSYSLWQHVFAGKLAALGRSIHLGGESYTIIGIMPQGFDYPDRTQVWIPLMAKYSANADPWWKLRDMRVNTVLGRLKPTVLPTEAQLDVDQVMSRLARQYPASNAGVHARVLSLRESETGGVRSYVLLVSGSVLLLLAIGCVNVAGLFIARVSGREREFAIRTALGATAWQAVKHLLTESLLYGMVGGLVGVGLAFVAIHALMGLLPMELPAWMELRIDWRVLSFATGISLTTALLCGLAPLLGQKRLDVNEALKQGSKGSSGVGTATTRVRHFLLVTEVALSLLLLIGAGLMLHSFAKLSHIETGVKTDHLVVATVTRYLPNISPAEQVKAYSTEYERIYAKLAALPGVTQASAGDDIPFLGQPETRDTADLFTKARPTRNLAYHESAASADVMPGYFKALGIPLLGGRDFTENDGITHPQVAIISQYTAQRLFPGRSAIGEQIRWGDNDTYNPWSTVIGIAGNTRWNPAERKPNLEVYWSAFQYPSSQITLLIRTTSSPQNLLPAVRQVIHSVSPNLAIMQSKTMDAIADETVWQHRLWSYVLGLFAALALLLTAVGLFGIMSYLVSQNTRDLGIRMAIGSTPAGVLRLVLHRGMRLVAYGLAIGLSIALAAHRLLASFLYGVSDTDPGTYAAVIALLIAITLIACGLPAWRASRIDPIVALKGE